MNVNISFSQFEQLYKQGITLDMLFLLQELSDNWGTSDFLHTKDEKIKILYQTLLRKGLIAEGGFISITGKELLESIKKEGTIPIKKKKVIDDSFERWYKAFPSTDFFEYKGKKFSGTRSLKNSKEDCKTKLKAILNEGEYTIDELIKALEFEVLQKKEQSLKTGTNKLSFMQNSLTYLRQRTFESFIELIKEGVEIKETSNIGGGTDI